MSSRELWTTGGIAAAALVLIALLGAGLLAPGREVTVSGAPVPAGGIPDPPADGSSGVVVDRHQVRGGLKLLGIRFRSPGYAAFVSMIAPDECIVEEGDGGSVVSGEGACGSLPAAGKIAGDGITAEGLRLTIVQVEIGEACYRELPIGSRWPTDIIECQENGG